MIRLRPLARLSLGLLLAAAAGGRTVLAQVAPKESIPGGVEARPSDATVGGVPKVAPAPAPATRGSPVLERAPAMTMPPPASPSPPPKATKDGKDAPGKDVPAKDMKKSSTTSPPAPLVRSIAPGGGAPAPGTPAAPANNETKPGAVERATIAPAPKQ